ncbi:5,10-methylenetetrahydrofolate reductase [Cutibacterium acnes JCM 18920]|nr:5,10-methylenetetrahydrofolate reductase [Cutibacterium acnes JCM 18920]
MEQMVADYAESRIDHILATRGVMLGGWDSLGGSSLGIT